MIITFKPLTSCIYIEHLELITTPILTDKIRLTLQGICLFSDNKKAKMMSLLQHIDLLATQISDTKNLTSNIKSKEKVIHTEHDKKIFFHRTNYKNGIYYYTELFLQLEELMNIVLSYHNRYERETFIWDYNVATLKDFIEQIPLRNKHMIPQLLSEYEILIEQCMIRPTPNQELYHLMYHSLLNSCKHIPRLFIAQQQSQQQQQLISSHEPSEFLSKAIKQLIIHAIDIFENHQNVYPQTNPIKNRLAIWGNSCNSINLGIKYETNFEKQRKLELKRRQKFRLQYIQVEKQYEDLFMDHHSVVCMDGSVSHVVVCTRDNFIYSYQCMNFKNDHEIKQQQEGKESKESKVKKKKKEEEEEEDHQQQVQLATPKKFDKTCIKALKCIDVLQGCEIKKVICRNKLDENIFLTTDGDVLFYPYNFFKKDIDQLVDEEIVNKKNKKKKTEKKTEKKTTSSNDQQQQEGEREGEGEESSQAQHQAIEITHSNKAYTIGLTPYLIATNIKDIALGQDDKHHFAIACDINGQVYTWGINNSCNILANKLITTSLYPQKIDFDDVYITHVYAGANHIICQTQENVLYSWGNNEYGQLGLGHKKNISTPTLIPSFKINHQIDISIKKNKKMMYYQTIQSIQCGLYHNLVLTQDHQVLIWGKSLATDVDQLKHLDKPQVITFDFINSSDYIKEIACGSLHCLALSNHGDVYAWGNNQYGQLGLDHNQDVFIPTIIQTIKVKEEQEIQMLNEKYPEQLHENTSRTLHIYAKSIHSFATRINLA